MRSASSRWGLASGFATARGLARPRPRNDHTYAAMTIRIWAHAMQEDEYDLSYSESDGQKRPYSTGLASNAGDSETVKSPRFDRAPHDLAHDRLVAARFCECLLDNRNWDQLATPCNRRELQRVPASRQIRLFADLEG